MKRESSNPAVQAILDAMTVASAHELRGTSRIGITVRLNDKIVGRVIRGRTGWQAEPHPRTAYALVASEDAGLLWLARRLHRQGVRP